MRDNRDRDGAHESSSARAAATGYAVTGSTTVGGAIAESATIDGTKIAGNASRDANHSYEQIAREILDKAAAADAADDERFGHKRGDELPAEFAGLRASGADLAVRDAVG